MGNKGGVTGLADRGGATGASVSRVSLVCCVQCECARIKCAPPAIAEGREEGNGRWEMGGERIDSRRKEGG